MITSLTLVHLVHLNPHFGSLHFLDNVDQMVVQLDVGTSSFSLYKTLSEGVFLSILIKSDVTSLLQGNGLTNLL